MIKAKKDLGQNFLVDQVALNKIFELINPKNTDHFLEIGPGKGALTKILANSTGRLDAVELDKDLLLSLKLINSEKLYIHNENILNFKITDIQGNEKLRIVGNLPYNISVPLVCDMLDATPIVSRMLEMVQKEVAERLVAGPGDPAYGLPSVKLAYHGVGRVVGRVPPSVFLPQPNLSLSSCATASKSFAPGH